MSSKIALNIVSILPVNSHSAYTLVLGEEEGDRKLPVLIGAFEAQAIAMEIEGIKPSRPLTHDLFVQAMQALEVEIEEVMITDLQEGIFFSKIRCKKGFDSFELDSRTSDAIALAVKFRCPIFIDPKIMDEAAYEGDKMETKVIDSPGRIAHEELIPGSKTHAGLEEHSMEELEAMLEEAIRDEDYTRAAKIRDEIKKRSA
ncbi:MAG: bifunctional nuclease family protein [Bacteroidetes bacterium]|nr:bifunctional nuclease family protein [Bacteroidota bacterium]